MIKRFESLDAMRGIGILLVVVGHSGIPNILQWWIWSFHMPLFFFLSGVLFKRGKTSDFQFIKRKTRSLLLPYFIYSFLIIFIQRLFDVKIEWIDNDKLLLNGWDGLALWFIPVLFLSEVAWLYIDKIKIPRIEMIVLIVAVLIGYYLSIKNIHLPYKLEVVFTSIFYYGIGALFSDKVKQYAETNTNAITILFCFLALIFNVTFCFLNPARFDMCYNVVGSFFLAHLSALSGVAFAFFSSVLLLNRLLSARVIVNSILYFGKNSLIILLTHQLLKVLLAAAFNTFDSHSLFIFLSRQVTFWILLIVLIEIINKYFYYSLGRTNHSSQI